MSTFTELIESAKAKGMKIEAFTNIGKQVRAYDTFEDCKACYGYGKYYEKLATYVTIQMTEHTFATWEFIGAELDFGFFSVYSQASGHTMKSFKQEQKALKKLGL